MIDFDDQGRRLCGCKSGLHKEDEGRTGAGLRSEEMTQRFHGGITN